MVGHRPLAVIQGAGEQHGPERRPVLSVLQDFQRLVPAVLDGGLILPNGSRIGLGTIHEVRVLPEQLLLRVAGQVGEGPIDEDDRVARKRGVGDEHRHTGHPDRFDEHAALLSHGLHVPLRQGPLGRVGQVVLEFIHS